MCHFHLLHTFIVLDQTLWFKNLSASGSQIECPPLLRTRPLQPLAKAAQKTVEWLCPKTPMHLTEESIG